MNNLYIFAIILLLIIIFFLFMSSFSVQIIRTERRPERRPNKKLIGGCKGTRWGCCNDGITGKVDPMGSNC